jgi:hypothetical protein
VATSYIQNVAKWVGAIATSKEEDWAYALAVLDTPIATVAVRLDRAMVPLADSDGYREAMVGTLAFDDQAGERQHTVDLAAAPEYGKQAFYQRMAREIACAMRQFQAALYLGIADGAASNWRLLEQRTDRQLIDFFHTTEYVGKPAQATCPHRQAKGKRAQWQQEHCQPIKHDPKALDGLIGEAARPSQRRALAQTVRDGAYSAWTYFNNHRQPMDYPAFVAAGLPIESGVTEAACKTLVKQRLRASGMRWKSNGAGIVLSLRALTHTAGRRKRFWQKIDQFGAACCC